MIVNPRWQHPWTLYLHAFIWTAVIAFNLGWLAERFLFKSSPEESGNKIQEERICENCKSCIKTSSVITENKNVTEHTNNKNN